MERTIVLVALILGAVAASAQDLAITGGRIIDGTDRVLEVGTVVIQNGRIVSVSDAPPPASVATVIDANGKTVMPAFIDGHRHVIRDDPARWLAEQAADRMREYLEAGFTTVLSAGDSQNEILELRRRINAGELSGPRILAAGRAPLARASGPRAPVDPARIDVSRPPHRPTESAAAIPEEETRATVRGHAANGFDAIKTVIIVTPDGPEESTLSTVVNEAHRQGIPSITHAVTVVDTLAAVRAGTDILVHTPHIGQLTGDEARFIAESGIPMMSTLGIFVPTFAVDNSLIRERTGLDNIPRFRDLDPFPMDTISSAGQGPVNARLLFDAGVVYGYGTDTRFVPREAFAHELKPLNLVFSPRDIVTIMTRNAAAVIGRSDELGTLEAGKLGDVVILDGNPLADSSALLDVTVVIKEGRVVADRR